MKHDPDLRLPNSEQIAFSKMRRQMKSQRKTLDELKEAFNILVAENKRLRRENKELKQENIQLKTDNKIYKNYIKGR